MKPQARTVVGVLRARSGAHVIEPFEVSEDPALEVKDGALGGAAAGDAVVAEIGRPARAKRGSEKRRLEARIVEVLDRLASSTTATETATGHLSTLHGIKSATAASA